MNRTWRLYRVRPGGVPRYCGAFPWLEDALAAARELGDGEYVIYGPHTRVVMTLNGGE
jgi:fructose-1,6-bisphosphatase